MKPRTTLYLTGLAATALLWGVQQTQGQAPAGPVNSGPIIPDYALPNYAYSPLPTVTGISRITVLNGGIGYTAPIITLSVNGVQTDTATASVVGGVITAIVPNTPTTVYSSIPTVVITDATGLGASAVAVPVVLAGTGLQKFVDSFAGIGSPNDLGQYLPVAQPMGANTPAGVPLDGDYYEIALVEYHQQMHSGLPASGTRLRGYVQIYPPGSGAGTGVPMLYPDGTAITVGGSPVYGYDKPRYLGPVIIATRNVPVRIKFYNLLPLTSKGGNLFLPADATLMGAGSYNIDWDPNDPNHAPLAAPITGTFAQNRAALHLHGGNTPWISDGTPHQWITPAGETQGAPYLTGVSQRNVPDMPVPPGGAETIYWSNEQGGRLMFYHDHAYGTTRLNVYAGEAAGYLLVDPAEENALAAVGVPGTLGTTPDVAHLLPLVIQDKTFVWGAPNATLGTPGTGTYAVDPLFADAVPTAQPGDLWFPSIYMPNQDPNNITGANPQGRWDYGPWFWPPQLGAIQPMPLHSAVPEAFVDTPVVNGTVYPYLNVQAAKYRLRILNACNDRMLNLQMYQADPLNGGVPVGANGLTEVKMVPATPNSSIPFPPVWLTQTPGLTPDVLDNRAGGVPDPRLRGPMMIQIGTEGGLLPAPALRPNTPVGFEQNKRNIVVLNVSEKTLFMGPAERADVIVDFSAYAGKTIILYSDAPAPVPGADPRNDTYTGDPDMSATAGVNAQGGPPSTLPGYGPNIRTIMQFRVAGTDPAPLTPGPTDYYDPAFLTSLQTAQAAAYLVSQPPPIVPQPAYPAPWSAPTNTYAKIADTSMTFLDVNNVSRTIPMLPKCIQELFDPVGRMNSLLGVELPFTTLTIQTTIPFEYIDPVTETVPAGTTQIWKITHNGVDTHAIHFHLVNVQVINRVGWDGMIRPPDNNELGWKETVRMNPLEDCIVAATAKPMTLPFPLPNSTRPLDVTMALTNTTGFTGVSPAGLPVTVTNSMTDFGWEYVWHCHLLGHEENDMMRPIVMTVPAAYQYVNNTVPPLVTISLSPLPNANGWEKANVLVTITATRQPLGTSIASITYGASGAQTVASTTVAGSTASFTVSAEGSTSISANATDTSLNPNTATATSTVQLDRTAPTLTATPSSASTISALGWYSAPVTVTLTATDTGSGVASITYSAAGAQNSVATTINASSVALVVNLDGVTTITYSALDKAGNASAPQNFTVKLDHAGPAVVWGIPTGPTKNQSGWFTGPVNYPYTVTSVSGYTLNGTSVPSPVNIVGPGAGLSASVSLTDNAGRVVSSTSPVVNIDTSLPTVALSAPTPAPNANGWYGLAQVPVTIAYTASDTFSGVATATPSNPLSFAKEGANQTANVTVTDVAGNQVVVASKPTLSIDLTPPTITYGPYTLVPANGVVGNAGFIWYRSASVAYSTADNLSGVALTTLPASPVAYAQGAGSFVSGTATDKAGNTSAVLSSTPYDVDNTPPAPPVAATVAPSNANGWNNANVTGITLSTSDGLSGLGTLTYTVTVQGRAGSIAGNANAALASHPLSYTTTPIALPGGNLTANGTYVVNITGAVTDAVGNSTPYNISLSVKIDKSLPSTVAATVAPAANGAGWINAASGANVIMTGNDNGVDTIYSVTYSATGAQAIAPTTVLGTSATLNISAQGLTTVSFFVTDQAGNNSTVRTVPVVRVDNVAPTVALGAITGNYNAAHTRLQSMTVPVTVKEAVSGIQSTTITVKLGATTVGTQTFAGGGATGTVNNSRTVNVAPNQATPQIYTVTVTSTDRAGNTSTSVSVTPRL